MRAARPYSVHLPRLRSVPMKHRKPSRSAAADKAEEIVRLEDLAPREETKGGERKQLFGQVPIRRPGRRLR